MYKKITFFLSGNSDCVDNEDLAKLLTQYSYDITTRANFMIGTGARASGQYKEWDYLLYYTHDGCNITSKDGKSEKNIQFIEEDDGYKIIEYLRKLINKVAE